MATESNESVPLKDVMANPLRPQNAEEFAKAMNLGYCILGGEKDGRFHVCTWGKEPRQKLAAAKIAEMLFEQFQKLSGDTGLASVTDNDFRQANAKAVADKAEALLKRMSKASEHSGEMHGLLRELCAVFDMKTKGDRGGE